MVDFVSLFQTVATAKNLEFIYGRLDYIELKLNAPTINNCSGLLYATPVTVTPQINSGLIAYRNYSTTLGLCRLSSLENYYDEKYFLELKDMAGLMEDVIEMLTGCSTDITLTSAKIDFEINKFADNLDVVLCELTFSDE